MTPDFLIVGAGIFGISAALELRKRKHSVAVLNPDTIPHPLAASTDISKVIRMEYGSDTEYMDMAIESIHRWKGYNEQFDDTLYHEVGYVLTSRDRLESPEQIYEKASYDNLMKRGFKPERLSSGALSKRFPAFADNIYHDGFFHGLAGYCESGRAVEVLTDYASSIGVQIIQGEEVIHILHSNSLAEGVRTKNGNRYEAGHVIVCAGNSTPYLVPDLMPYMKITGHPVFHIKPSQPELFQEPNFVVFAADIANSGWYGFPLHPRKGVVKVANHGKGLELNPLTDERVVHPSDESNLRKFLKESIPSLANDPIVYTRRCCYTDTLDGHFWIDHHPAIKGLSIASGGSGHGFKMGPVVGEMVADLVTKGDHKWLARHRWRNLRPNTIQMEEARFHEG